MTDDLIAWVSLEIATEEWKTHGLQDVRIGVTREGLAATKRRLAERIVEHVLAQRRACTWCGHSIVDDSRAA